MEAAEHPEVNFLSEKVFKIVKQMEALAEDILADRQKMIELDKRRQKNREALRALKKLEAGKTEASRTWCVHGSSFVRTDTRVAEAAISAEQSEIENEIETVRKRMKKTMQELSSLEGRKGIEHFDLKPLNRDEKDALYKIIGAS
ncbi:p53 and DNA damage-regulated protein 1 [Galendromus occidentalis]|uniref:P53 and DNA damage-regulated protein 1 n=1 Tax=Galendromus occidentalis TaxID=34638 RepID=A0AAJ6VXP5_9ACAR|nr:p53 and DNA damage-regulated protein 1 [Galendromus occidentalis]